MEKKLHKSASNRMLAGVCGGVAEYLSVDPTVVRVVWAIASAFAGAGVIAYIACAIIMPEA
ncbi:MAG: PspC domain-containing protein [Oscillospiraceae bacterium]|jgi:phage shock protein PspC (stress-responsive transcriptional regulator)|nr:PspC domain-containing protein [Oscillospiraceae bacterium]